jgi:outer membrane protein
MNRIILLLFSFFVLTVSAQNDSVPAPTFRFGFLSYDSALVSMRDYAIVQQKMKGMREAYQQELKRVEEEFNQKYEAFLDGQRDFPRTILLKRQTELQQLMERNVEFKAQSLRELQEAETEALKPLRTRLSEMLATLARRHGLALIINTDANACPFIDPTIGIDLQQEVSTALNRR